MSTQNHVQTGRFYTAARKFQQLIGVTPAGETIPGGPYTITQVVAGIVVLAVGFLTRPLWSQDVFADVLIIVAAAIGITYLVGRMPGSRRSIINLLNCWITLMLRPRTGTYRGKKMPTSYSKGKPRRTVPAKQTGTEETAETAQSDDQDAPAVKHVQINSGLDRLTADLTTAR